MSSKTGQVVEARWKQFTILFGTGAVIKLSGKYALPYAFTLAEIDHETMFLTSVTIQLVGALLTAFALGYYGWKISGNWKNIFVGLLGFFWLALLGPIIGLYLVNRAYSKVQKVS